MCGICGKLSFTGHSADDVRSLAHRMCSVMAHRGPDDEGIYADPWIAMGNRRLSIIDLTGGHQPISNEDGTIWLVYNGEIYNYRKLAKELRHRGHTLRTASDTEVILHLYEDMGEECVHPLNGIFSFALWDAPKRRLVLARDRLGVKPLFYIANARCLVFGSEIKAIIQDPQINRQLDPQALSDFLSFNYVPAPRTILAGITALPPGHILTCEGGEVQLVRYWDVSFSEAQSQCRSEEEYIEGLQHEISRAVKMQMVSDVPVGAFLSGGVDSSTIVALMAQAADQQIKTFSVGFEQKSYDELSYARLASNYFGTDHYEVTCTPHRFREVLRDIVWQADSLLADMSLLPVYLVSQLASRHLKVILSGDGSDELFAGYTTYLADRLAKLYRRLPMRLRDGLLPWAIERLPNSNKKMNFQFKAERFVRGASLLPEEAHCSWRYIFSPEEKALLFSDKVKREIGDHESFTAYGHAYAIADTWDELSRHQYADMKVWLVDSILAKVDYMSMAHSLEVRVPFLDHKVVEYAAAVPPSLRLRGRTNKYILRRAVKNLLPQQIVNRPKAGFQIPVDAWFRNELATIVRDILTERAVRDMGIFDWTFVDKLVSSHLSGQSNHGLKLLGLVTFFTWYDLFL